LTTREPPCTAVHRELEPPRCQKRRDDRSRHASADPWRRSCPSADEANGGRRRSNRTSVASPRAPSEAASGASRPRRASRPASVGAAVAGAAGAAAHPPRRSCRRSSLPRRRRAARSGVGSAAQFISPRAAGLATRGKNASSAKSVADARQNGALSLLVDAVAETFRQARPVSDGRIDACPLTSSCSRAPD